MRMPKLGPRDRRAVLLGTAVLAPALAWAFAVRPYLGAVADAGDRLAVERRLLRGELELVAAAPAYPRAFEEGAQRLLAAAARLMGGDDEGAASAALAGYLRRMAQAGGANLTRVEPAAAADAGTGVRALPVAVTGETDLEGLLTFLQLLESGPRLVHVQDLRVEAAAPPAQGAAYAASPYLPAPDAQPEVITFRFTATAFTLAQPGNGAGVEEDADAPPSTESAEPSAVDELRQAEGGAR